MPARRIIALGVAGAAVVVAGGVALVALDDPDESVDAVNVSEAGAVGAGAGSATTADGAARQVPGLDELAGTVTLEDGADGDEVWDDLEINGVDLDFGPDDWIRTAEAPADLDGDGTTAALGDELTGLVDREVTLLVRYDEDGDDADVYVVDGTTYRDVSAAPPWQPAGAATEDAVRAAAAAAVGDGAEVVELDAEDDGNVAWEAKVRAADGTEREVLLDAAGTVIDASDDD